MNKLLADLTKLVVEDALNDYFQSKVKVTDTGIRFRVEALEWEDTTTFVARIKTILKEINLRKFI